MKKTISMTVDFRLVSALLFGIILLIVGLWRPWSDSGAVTRSITVAGHSRIKAEPDSFRFTPTYQRTSGNREAAIDALNEHVADVTAELEDLGVAKENITLQANSYELYYAEPSKNDAVTASVTVEVPNKELAQKVQNYLLTTDPQGAITPYPVFSDEKRAKLENEARDKAVADARVQAERTAQQLDVKIGKVVNVKDAASGGIILPMERGVAMDSSQGSSTLPIYPGQDEVSFSVEASFEIR